jgi:TfoX/Sxy family transcriptional regulator of competence genes
MTGDDDLAARVRACLAGVDGVSERKMFGGVGFMLNGNMLAGTSKRGLLLRVGKEHHAEAVAERGIRAMEQRGRVMEGYVYVDPPPELDAALKAWLKPALDHVARLRRSRPKRRKSRRGLGGVADSATRSVVIASDPGSSPGRSSGTMGVERRRRSSERSVWSKELVALLRALSCWPWTASARRSALTRSAGEAGVVSGSARELRRHHVASFARFAIRTV